MRLAWSTSEAAAATRRGPAPGSGAVITMVANAVSVFGATAVNLALGFVFWTVAARLLGPIDLGFASATVSALTVAGTVATMGLGTLLMGELSSHRAPAPSALIAVSVAFAACVGAIASVVLVEALRLASGSLATLGTDPFRTAVFALGGACTAAALVLDQACLGLLRGGLQLTRNTVYSVARLVGVGMLVGWAGVRSGDAAVAVWVLALAMSLGAVAGFRDMPTWSELRMAATRLRSQLGYALRHHALNISQQTPRLALPVLVAVILSVRANGYFYLAFMLDTVLFMIPAALATALYPATAVDLRRLTANLRFSLCVSALVAASGVLVLVLAARPLLSVFGAEYARHAVTPLRTMALGVFPLIIKEHYTATMRLSMRPGAGVRLAAVGACLELGGGACGALLGGLEGVPFGWLAGLVVGAALMLRPMRRQGQSAAREVAR